jgi:multiple sugar transport system ATP-binding protein
MRASLKALQQELGITTVYVTHDQVEAQSLGDRIVVMKLGVIQQVGTPQQIYTQPANLFVAGFIGTPSMNFMDCSLQVEAGEAHLRNQHFDLVLGRTRLPQIQDGARERSLVMGIRPEHIRMLPQADGKALAAEVSVVEPQSNEVVVGLKLGQHLVKARRDRRKMEFKPKTGQAVWITLPPEKIHLFDKDTEACLV